MKTIIISFVLLVLSSCLLIYFTDSFILTPAFYARSGEFLSGVPSENINLYANIQQWSYLYQCIYCVVKVILIASILHCGLYLSGQQVTFRRLVLIAVHAEYVFIFGAIIKASWFYWQYPEGKLLEWHRTYPFSCLSFFPDVPPVWWYPLQTLNIFEISYWFLLALGISRITSTNLDTALQVIVRSYLPALLVWEIGVCFATAMFFPSQV